MLAATNIGSKKYNENQLFVVSSLGNPPFLDIQNWRERPWKSSKKNSGQIKHSNQKKRKNDNTQTSKYLGSPETWNDVGEKKWNYFQKNFAAVLRFITETHKFSKLLIFYSLSLPKTKFFDTGKAIMEQVQKSPGRNNNWFRKEPIKRLWYTQFLTQHDWFGW